MALENLSPRGRLILFIVIGVLIFVLFYAKVYKSGQNKIQTLEKDKESLESKIRMLKRERGHLRRLKREIKEKERKLADLERILPSRKEVEQILRIVQQRAKSTDLVMDVFTPKGERPKSIKVKQRKVTTKKGRRVVTYEQVEIPNVYSEWPINFSVKGRYHDLAIFFVHLCSLSRVFTVDNFKINSIKNQTDRLTISSNVNAKTYIFKNQVDETQKGKKLARR